MTTGIASGLGATWGFGKEAPGTWATPVSPTRWLPMTSDKVVGSKKIVQSQALNGTFFELARRRRIAFRDAKGQVDLDLTDRQLGLLIEMMLGGAPTVTPIGTAPTAPTRQLFVPGTTLTKSLTLQSGRPEVTTGTIQPFTYPGAKIVGWEISVDTAGLAKVMLTFDAKNELTTLTLVAASYVPDNVLAFTDGTLLLGGTLSTVGGKWTVATGAVPVGVVSAVSLKGANNLAVERQQIGSETKSQQLVNAFRKYTGSFEVEFANLTDVYDAYYSDTPVILQLNFTGDPVTTTANAGLNVLCPSVKFNGTPPATDGPAILKFAAPFDVLYDQVHPAIQMEYITADMAP